MTQNRSNKRDNILRAALELFADRGFHDAPMAQLARQANVAVGSIYRYFKDKDSLIHELYKEVDDSLQRALASKIEPELSTQRQFVHLVTCLIHYLIAHPREFKFLEQYYNSPFGIEMKREKLLCSGNSSHKSAFADFFYRTENNGIKPHSSHVLHALTIGPVTFLLRDAAAGLVIPDDTTIKNLAEGCWDAISR